MHVVCVSGLGGGPGLYHEPRDAGIPLVAGHPTATLQAAVPPTAPVAPNDQHLSPPVPRRLQTQFSEVATQMTLPDSVEDVEVPTLSPTIVPTPIEPPKNEGMGPVVQGPSSAPATPSDFVEVVEPPVLPDNQLGDSDVVRGAASPEQSAVPGTPKTQLAGDGQKTPEIPVEKTPVDKTPVDTSTAATGKSQEPKSEIAAAKRKITPKPKPKSSSSMYTDGSYWKTLI